MRRAPPAPPRPSKPSLALGLAFTMIAACGTNVDLGGGGADAAADALADSGTCPDLAPPGASAPCGACNKTRSNCQANGCFNGYFCDVLEQDCQPPGTPCARDARAP